MRRSLVIVAVVGLLMILSALVPLAASAAPPTTGERVSVFDGVDVEIPAGAPFFVRHGWAGESHPMSTFHNYQFNLYVDGELKHGVPDIVIDKGRWLDVYWISNFRHGLPAGTYTFSGEWIDPTGIAHETEITVTAYN